VSICNENGVIIYDSEYPENDKLMSDANLADGSILHLSDGVGDRGNVNIVLRCGNDGAAQIRVPPKRPVITNYDADDWEGSDVEIISD
jgi:hypothetical protein